jgi:hypothetical protein
MFCPKCATQNPDGGSFCRSCGANISLIPQALNGQLQEVPADESCLGRKARRLSKGLSLDQSFRNVFMGIAFLIVAIALSRTIGAGWWFWMLLPAFSLMGTGIAQFIRLKEQEKRGMLGADQSIRSFSDRAPVQRDLVAPRTGELMAPVPSVTESTTRHLGVEAPTRHFEAEQK